MTTKPYDLSIPLTALDGRPLTPVGLGIPPTYEEEQDEGWNTSKAENKVASYMEEPASIARMILTALMAEEAVDPDKKSPPKSKKEIRDERKEKEVRYDIALALRRATRDGTTDAVPLSKAEVDLILDRVSFCFALAVFGPVREALRTPNVAERKEAAE